MPRYESWLTLWQSSAFPFPGAFCSLDDVKRNLELPPVLVTDSAQDKANKTKDDDVFVSRIFEASAAFSDGTNRFFLPYLDTLIIPIVYGQPKVSGVDILSIVSISDSTGVLPVEAYSLTPANGCPKSGIVLNAAWLEANPSRPSSDLTVMALCGMVTQPDTMWHAEAALGAGIDGAETAVTLDVSNTSAGLSVLDYIRIGDEAMLVTSITLKAAPDLTALTVERGVLGTTAAEHVTGTAIEVFRQIPDVRLAVVLRAAHLYRIRTSPGGEVIAGPQGTARISRVEDEFVTTAEGRYARNTGGLLGALRRAVR